VRQEGFGYLDRPQRVTVCALSAAALGLVVEPQLQLREPRRGLLRDLAHELVRNRQVLEAPPLQSRDGTYVTYPRVSTTVVGTALSSGMFSAGKDDRLIKDLHGWHEVAAELNRGLGILERETFSALPETRRVAKRGVLRGEGALKIRRQFQALHDCLIEDYAVESGVTADTLIFVGGKDEDGDGG